MADERDRERPVNGRPGGGRGRQHQPFVPGQATGKKPPPAQETPGPPSAKPGREGTQPPAGHGQPPPPAGPQAGPPAQPPQAAGPPRAPADAGQAAQATPAVGVPAQGQPPQAEGGDEGPGRRPRVKSWMILIVLGILAIVFSFVLIRSATRPGVKYEKVSFTTEGLEAPPVKIAGLLMKPARMPPGKLPGVVFAHGATASKEWYIQMTRSLVRQGFIVLAIDLRGHGSSGGYCTFGNDEVRDVWAAADYLRKNVPEVDPQHIVAMGHSLGGIASTRAGALQPDRRLSAVSAIYCWTSYRDALQDLFGPIDDFVGRGWQFTTFSKHIDMNAPDFDQKYSIIDVVDDTHPPNYLLIIGRADELVSVEREEQIMEKVTAQARRTGPQNKLKDGYTYGDFAAGTARRLALTNDDHVTELGGGVITLEGINWIKQDSGIPVKPTDRAPFLWGRFLGIITLSLGFLFLIVGILSLLRGRMFGWEQDVDIDPPWGESGQQGLWELLLYAVPVVAASYLALPAAKAFSIGPFIPYAGINETSIFFLSRAIVLLPFVIALAVVVIMKKGGIKRFVIEDMSRWPLRWAKGGGYALIPLAVILIIMAVLSGPLILPMWFPKLPVYSVIGVVCIGGGFWLEDYLFYKLAYPALERYDGGPDQRRAIVVHGLVLDLVLIFALLPIMKGVGVTLHFQAFKVPLLLVMLLAMPAFFFVSWLSLRLRQLTGSSLSYALMFSAIAVWFLTAPISVRGF